MIAKIEKGIAFGSVTAPPSKSVAHRYLICGALSGGSRIDSVDFSEDIKATLKSLSALGARVKIEGNSVDIGGLDIHKDITNTELLCNESGSTLRFLIPICLLFNKQIKLSGSKRLMERSLSVYEDMCKAQNISFSKNDSQVTVCGKLKSGKYSIPGNISSQFISGLMFALPNLKEDSIIDITDSKESASYLKLTTKALADFGVRISRIDENSLFIKGNQTFKKRHLVVEGDYSNAAFFEALNCLGGNVHVSGLDLDSAQGDKVYKKYFEQIKSGTPTLDVSDCPDLAPVLMAVAAANNGVLLTGTSRLKIKESDRGNAMAQELAKFGCKVTVGENAIRVEKGELKVPELPLNSHNDHRIVMALAILATLTGGEIYGAEAVNKSFPDFFERLRLVNVKVNIL